MKRPLALGCLALAASLAAANLSQADENPQPPRGNLLLQPGLRPAAPNRTPAVPGGSAANQGPAVPPDAAQVSPGPHPGYYLLPVRPVTWGVRYGVTNGYPPSLFGQGFVDLNAQGTVPQVAAPQPGEPAAPIYTNPPAGSYANTPAPYPPAGLSSIYGYAGRFYGPYYGYGPMYYGYGGTGGWGSAYNSAYYTGGYYQGNACCRAGRRYATPFGGAGYGWGSGCYVMVPPPCPTICDPCLPAGPAAGTPLPAPSATPPSPQPPAGATPPAPIEKRVVPAPQAQLLPRIPDMPPDA
jgi:hypothetical protein